MTGIIKRVRADKGFGFLRGDDEAHDRFFHVSALRGIDIATLAEGTRVQFEHEDGDKGPRATNIQPLS